MLPSSKNVALANDLLQLTEAIENLEIATIYNAIHVMDIYKLLDNKEAMKAIFRKMKLLDRALLEFQRTHGTDLDD